MLSLGKIISTDKKAIELAKCADELRKEIMTVCAEFSYLNIISDEIQSLVYDETKFLFYNYKTRIGGMIGNYLLKPIFDKTITQHEYDILFGNSQIHHEASSIMGMTINQRLLTDEGQLRFEVLESFICGLEDDLIRYFVAIKETPSIFLNYRDLAEHKKNNIKEITEKYNIALDGDKGIFPHLFQHLMRIPLLLKTMHALAEESKLLRIKEYGPRICELHSEISRLLVKINESTKKVKY